MDRIDEKTEIGTVEAAYILGVNKKVLYYYARNGKLKNRIGTIDKKRRSHIFCRAEIEALRVERELIQINPSTEVDTSTAAEMLGISRQRLYISYIYTGQLKPRTGMVSGKTTEHIIDRVQVEDLRQAISGGRVERHYGLQIDNETEIDRAEAARILGVTAPSLATYERNGLLDRRIGVVGNRRVNLYKRVQVEKLRDEREASKISSGTEVGSFEATKILGVKQATIQHYQVSGRLKSRVGLVSGREVRIYQRSEVEALREARENQG